MLTAWRDKENGWMYHADLVRLAEICFSDMSPEEGLAWAKLMPQHSGPSFATPLSHAGYLDAPVSYLLCENDLCIPAAIQREEIEMIERKSGSKVKVTTIPTDHCPSASSPQLVVDWLVSLVA